MTSDKFVRYTSIENHYQEGFLEKETVKRMLRKNVKVEDIVEFTGLTKEEIEKIKNEE